LKSREAVLLIARGIGHLQTADYDKKTNTTAKSARGKGDRYKFKNNGKSEERLFVPQKQSGREGASAWPDVPQERDEEKRPATPLRMTVRVFSRGACLSASKATTDPSSAPKRPRSG
jgi:hypothetical protein